MALETDGCPPVSSLYLQKFKYGWRCSCPRMLFSVSVSLLKADTLFFICTPMNINMYLLQTNRKLECFTHCEPWRFFPKENYIYHSLKLCSICKLTVTHIQNFTNSYQKTNKQTNTKRSEFLPNPFCSIWLKSYSMYVLNKIVQYNNIQSIVFLQLLYKKLVYDLWFCLKIKLCSKGPNVNQTIKKNTFKYLILIDFCYIYILLLFC